MRSTFHPILFALLPVASLLSWNIESVAIRHAFRPGIFALAGAILLMLVLIKAYRDWCRAGIIASSFMLLFFTYGYIQDYVVDPFAQTDSQSVGRHVALMMGVAALLILLAFLLSRVRIDLQKINSLLNVVAIGALAVPLIRIADHELRGLETWPSGVEKPMAEFTITSSADPLPDIYYIVLDGYGRADVLSEIYGLDNSPFLEFLNEIGFFVGTHSSSNYGVTHLSIASSLNMSYLDLLAEAVGKQSDDHRPITTLLQQSAVLERVRDLGYNLVAFESGYRRTELREADMFFTMPVKSATPFEAVLIEYSVIRAVLDGLSELGASRWYPGYKAHGELVHFLLDQLESAPDLEGPKFVFAHIFAPHPPFLYKADGTIVSPDYPYSTLDGDYFPGSADDYVKGYRDQVLYLNSRLTEVVRKLNTDSEIPPIIILQGDHGSGLMVRWDDPVKTNLFERMSILNAISLPGTKPDQISPGISPVNTFRLIFNEEFGADLPIVEDKSFFSSYKQPYDFVQGLYSD